MRKFYGIGINERIHSLIIRIRVEQLNLMVIYKPELD